MAADESPRGFVPLDDRGVLAVGGPDARSLLQGLISNDIERVSPTRSIYAALLTPQGKFLFDFFIGQLDDRLLLDTERARLDDLVRRLTMYRLRAKATFEDVSGRFGVAALLGDGVAAAVGLPDEEGAARPLEGGVVLIEPRHKALGGRAILPAASRTAALEGLGLAELDREAYDRRRIELGLPDGSRDMRIEKAILLENGFEELHGVDFAKGCFVGQELTARTKYRGLIRKRLMPVVLRGPRPEPDAIIRLGEREAGEMRSSVDGWGLALLRLEQVERARAEGTPLKVGETEVVPVRPDWALF
jgi:folate-binding protein YgfZ